MSPVFCCDCQVPLREEGPLTASCFCCCSPKMKGAGTGSLQEITFSVGVLCLEQGFTLTKRVEFKWALFPGGGDASSAQKAAVCLYQKQLSASSTKGIVPAVAHGTKAHIWESQDVTKKGRRR